MAQIARRRQEFLKRQHPGIQETQGRHERAMDLGRGNNHTLKGKLPGCAGVMDHQAAEAQVRRGQRPGFS